MLAGIAAYVKRVRPGVLVIGVEAEDAAGMTASIKAGKLTTLDQVGIFADGAAVRTVGTETFRICNELVDDMVTVSNDEICAAIKDGFMDTRSILEPAGALAIAGAKKWIGQSNVRDNTCAPPRNSGALPAQNSAPFGAPLRRASGPAPLLSAGTSRSRRARTWTSTGCASSPSAPTSRKRSSRSRSPSAPAPSAR